MERVDVEGAEGRKGYPHNRETREGVAGRRTEET